MCYDCNRKTKSKLEDETKKKHIHYVCLAHLYDDTSADEETESIFHCGCII